MQLITNNQIFIIQQKILANLTVLQNCEVDASKKTRAKICALIKKLESTLLASPSLRHLPEVLTALQNLQTAAAAQQEGRLAARIHHIMNGHFSQEGKYRRKASPLNENLGHFLMHAPLEIGATIAKNLNNRELRALSVTSKELHALSDIEKFQRLQAGASIIGLGFCEKTLISFLTRLTAEQRSTITRIDLPIRDIRTILSLCPRLEHLSSESLVIFGRPEACAFIQSQQHLRKLTLPTIELNSEAVQSLRDTPPCRLKNAQGDSISIAIELNPSSHRLRGEEVISLLDTLNRMEVDVETLTITHLELFGIQLSDILNRTPKLSKLSLLAPHLLSALILHPIASKIKTLDISWQHSLLPAEFTISQLLDAIPNVETLRVGCDGSFKSLSQKEVGELARHPLAKKLKELRLPNHVLGPTEMCALADNLHSLEVLDLSQNASKRSADAALALTSALVREQKLPNLHTLVLFRRFFLDPLLQKDLSQKLRAIGVQVI